MSVRVQKHVDILRALVQLKPKQRKALLETADPGLIFALCEVAKNILAGNIALTLGQKRSLARHRIVLRRLACRKVPLKEKRTMLINQSGGFFWLPFLAPVLGYLAKTAVQAIVEKIRNRKNPQ